jgi:capsular polysaccharide biosynthesis protein
VFDVDPDPSHRKLYVTRRNAKVRRLTNEDEVADYLSERGFDVVALETLPQREQIKRFAEAQFVVAQHGAGLTNLLYARDASVLEIMSDEDKLIFYRLISESLGHPHRQLHMDGNNKNDDVYLPIGRLAEALDELEAESLSIKS